MPLCFLCGFVDDADPHEIYAFNDTHASVGIRVVITGSDGYSAPLESHDVMRNPGNIAVNSANSFHIPEIIEPAVTARRDECDRKSRRDRHRSITLLPLVNPPVAGFTFAEWVSSDN